MRVRLPKFYLEDNSLPYVFYGTDSRLHRFSTHSPQRNSPNKYIKNFDFNYPQTNSQFTVTSVTGHLIEHDFEETYSNWRSCDPFLLFDAPVVAKVKKGSETIARNLREEAKKAQVLMIWTDCDREGENIGAEVAGVCKKAKAKIGRAHV